MELSFSKCKKSSYGYYIDGQIQWASGRDYFKYTSIFNRVYIKMFPENKAPKEWNNILVIGGGDFQLIGDCNFLSYDNRITVVDPSVTEYFNKLEDIKNKVKVVYKSQRSAYENKAFLNIVEMPIQQFINETEETFDLIVVDLTDELAADVNNEYMSQVFDKLLRPHGTMIGYGGLDYNQFITECPLVLFEVEELHISREWFESWDDEGVFYGVRKCKGS